MIIELPCRHDCWSAPNSHQWTQRLSVGDSIPSALQGTLVQTWGDKWFADDQLDFARLIMVYALAALAWDLTYRDVIGKRKRLLVSSRTLSNPVPQVLTETGTIRIATCEFGLIIPKEPVY